MIAATSIFYCVCKWTENAWVSVEKQWPIGHADILLWYGLETYFSLIFHFHAANKTYGDKVRSGHQWIPIYFYLGFPEVSTSKIAEKVPLLFGFYKGSTISISCCPKGFHYLKAHFPSMTSHTRAFPFHSPWSIIFTFMFTKKTKIQQKNFKTISCSPIFASSVIPCLARFKQSQSLYISRRGTF